MNFERDIARVFVRAAIWQLARRAPTWVLILILVAAILATLVARVRADQLTCETHDQYRLGFPLDTKTAVDE
jgi:hypothetical protein